MAIQIHPTSIIEKGAQISEGVVIGPFCHVGENVVLGENCELKSHVVIAGKTTIGKKNIFHPFCALGGDPQDLNYKGEDTELIVGNENIFREGASVHRGTVQGKGKTTIGNNNFIMAYCHIAHDCILHDHVIMANQAAIAGHVELESYVIMSGQSGITQFSRVGKYSFITANGGVRRDLPPFMVAKDFSLVVGPNLVGLKRRGFSSDDIYVIKNLYKIFYLGQHTLELALKKIDARFGSNEHAQYFIDFVRKSKIGVQR